MEQAGWRVTAGDTVTGAPDLILVGKPGASQIEERGKFWLDQLRAHRAKGAQSLLDYTDHHLGFPSLMTDFYRKALDVCDACVTPSTHMVHLLSATWNGPIFQINDPIEVHTLAPRLTLNEKKTVLWFGHASNIEYLTRFMIENQDWCTAVRFLVVTDLQGLNLFNRLTEKIKDKPDFRHIPWSVENLINAAKLSDACVIPSDNQDPRKAGASTNRLITALALGLPTAAENLPSYRDFSFYYLDIHSKSVNELVENPGRFFDLVLSAQEKVVPNFQTATISAEWKKLAFGLTDGF